MAIISLRQLLDHAAEHGYGVPAYNVNNMEQMPAIMDAAEEADVFTFTGQAGDEFLLRWSRPEAGAAGGALKIAECKRNQPRGAVAVQGHSHGFGFGRGHPARLSMGRFFTG